MTDERSPFSGTATVTRHPNPTERERRARGHLVPALDRRRQCTAAMPTRCRTSGILGRVATTGQRFLGLRRHRVRPRGLPNGADDNLQPRLRADLRHARGDREPGRLPARGRHGQPQRRPHVAVGHRDHERERGRDLHLDPVGAPGYTVSTSSGAASPQLTGVTLTANQTTPASLTVPVGSIQATVTDGSALAGATVNLHRAERLLRERRPDEREWSVHLHERPGPRRLHGRGDLGRPDRQQTPVTVNSGSTTSVALSLAGTVAVTVTSGGLPLASQSVTLTGPNSYSSTASTNASGVVSFHERSRRQRLPRRRDPFLDDGHLRQPDGHARHDDERLAGLGAGVSGLSPTTGVVGSSATINRPPSRRTPP